MRIDGVDYSVANCSKMSKSEFVEKMAIYCQDLDKETQEIYLSMVYELIKVGS